MPSVVPWFGRSARETARAEDAVAQETRALAARLEKLEAQVVMTERYFTEAFWTALDAAYEAILPERVLACIVCGRQGRRDAFEVRVDHCLFGGGRLERYVCPDCDCVFGPQKYLDLGEAFVGRDYQVLYSRYSEADSTARELRAFRSLEPEKSGRYLDWGAGGGWNRTLETLRAEGWDVAGHEPHALEPDPSRPPLTGGAFDGLFSNNVIEHFRDPITQFQQFHWLLKPGGKMAHASPCYDYCFAYTRFHTVFLLGRSPFVLAERTGFAVVADERDGQYINYVFQRL
ncbi:methyltransferase domain-containing protein [uncultured Caulobacter sp.]|uniref:class I SAM-dependent methyltransferase n=1 Tax=uncultured Caulobacter sp. TaxID=158749 RepID=UPI002627C1B0|nr:methyltransferase domain-containing protein [uncultured Caulobacter sp.]